MDGLIDRLRVGGQRANLGGETSQELFDLLLAACSYCCTQYTGGNESCPPKKVEIAQ